MTSRLRFARVLLAFVGAGLPAQEWQLRPGLTGRLDHAMCYDSVRDRVVLFGGSDAETWEWDGREWTARRPAQSPRGRSAHAMVYDSQRQRVVLFGGTVPGSFADTWEWDGENWSQRATTGPSERFNHAMAYDPVAGVVLLFGGSDLGPMGDTWSWDGTTWRQLSPAQSPSARSQHTMAYDAERQRIVLFSGGPDDTWEWDGANWLQRSPVNSPGGRTGHSMAYDAARQRIVVFGGQVFGFAFDTWEWDGTDWTEAIAFPRPQLQSHQATAYHGGLQRIVMFGGLPQSGPRRDQTWLWDGVAWSEHRPGEVPSPWSQPAMTYDAPRQRVLLFDSDGSATSLTWEWDGASWNPLPLSPVPTGFEHYMAYDAARAETVLYGGVGAGSPMRTWIFDGQSWTQQFPKRSPPARGGTAMVYDGARGRVTVFGGWGIGGAVFRDTWVWDGIIWGHVGEPGSAPPGRSDHALAYDAARQRVVMFGGRDGTQTVLGETWEWDGTRWDERFPSVSPPARMSAAMTYDADRSRIVLLGGSDGTTGAGTFDDMWEWDGVTWTERSLAAPPAVRAQHAMVYEAAAQRILMFGGRGRNGRDLHETWFYASGTAAAVFKRGASCGTTTSTLVGYGLPTTGNSSFAIDLMRGAASVPAAVLLSAGGGSLPLGSGCSLLIDAGRLLMAPALATNPGGFASLSTPIPRNTVFVGATLHAQAAYPDPGGWNGLALTNGLEVTVGH